MTVPIKRVLLPNDIEKWEKSEAYQDILGFITVMNNSVKGKKLSDACHISDVSNGICKMLETISGWIDDILPIDQPQRYGNKAFRTFYSRLKEQSIGLLTEHMPESFHLSIPEIATYLEESFGNSTRIDYGTGHELAFVMFLCCLHKIEALNKEDSVCTVTKIFKSYLDLARKLQQVYKMEPAGSQGVWSLDDYQFIPFIWGSSQLVMHPKISPDMFTNEKLVSEYSKDYLFLGCVEYILQVKSGPFAEHSNQLWNVSAVQSWSKVNQGLIKMYKAEILHKFPIVQHVLFGSLMSFDSAKHVQFAPPSELVALKESVGVTRSKMATSAHPGEFMPPPHSHLPPLHGYLPQDVMPKFRLPGDVIHPKAQSKDEGMHEEN